MFHKEIFLACDGVLSGLHLRHHRGAQEPASRGGNIRHLLRELYITRFLLSVIYYETHRTKQDQRYSFDSIFQKFLFLFVKPLEVFKSKTIL